MLASELRSVVASVGSVSVVPDTHIHVVAPRVNDLQVEGRVNKLVLMFY